MSTPETRVRKFATIRSGFPFASKLFSSEGEIPLVRIRDVLAKDFQTYVPKAEVPESAWIADGDVLIGMDGDFNSVLWKRGHAALNQRTCALRALPNADSRYLAYAIPKGLAVINDLTYYTTVKHLSSEQVLDLPLPDHGLPAQRAIADYLDRETAEINAMVVDLEELMTMLQERRTAAITEAVTGKDRPGYCEAGLQVQDGPQTSEGVTAPIGAIGEITLGKMVTNKVDHESGIVAPYLRAAHVQPWGRIDLGVQEKRMWFGEMEIRRLELRRGDVVIVEGGAGYGRAASLDFDFDRWGFQNSIIRVRPYSDLASGKYLSYALQHALAVGKIDTEISTATIPHFTAEKVAKFRIPHHDIATQRAIVVHLDEITAEIDSMIADAQKLKALLAERRSALIAEVVSGRKEVPVS